MENLTIAAGKILFPGRRGRVSLHPWVFVASGLNILRRNLRRPEEVIGRFDRSAEVIDRGCHPGYYRGGDRRRE